MSNQAELLQRYFQRIEYTGDARPTLENLRCIVPLHQRAIPFENIDVLLGRTPRLDAESLCMKLLDRRRGGYCFEQNGLLALVLAAMGYRFDRLMARVHYRNPLPVPALSHMLLRVRLHEETDAGDVIVDVGFGGVGPAGPMALPAPGTATRAPLLRLTAPENASGYWTLECVRDRKVEKIYAFGRVAYEAIDSEHANFALANRASSLFVNNLWVLRPGAGGAVSLYNRSLARLDAAMRSVPEPCALDPRHGPVETAGLDAILCREFAIELTMQELDGLASWLNSHQRAV